LYLCEPFLSEPYLDGQKLGEPDFDELIFSLFLLFGSPKFGLPMLRYKNIYLS
jgi:hypothetical protein